ncbi:MAG: GatB/YqeY domain-containing protein [Chloroflexi bacterium]|nr:GatB/YqeY domain-containing protein [Chloroflexota bacterium]
MSLRDQLSEDLKQAVRAGDHTRRDVIRFLRAAIQNEEIERQRPLEDNEILAVIQRQVKQRREAITLFAQGNRADLVNKEEMELKILQEYLPTQLSEEEIAARAKEIIRDLGATGRGDLGKVMSRLMGELRGRAEGQAVSRVVQSLLDNPA